MHNAIPLILAALIAVGIIVIGCFYLVSPERILGTFGLKPPASDADTLAWLRPKGIRDVVAGLVVLAMMLTADWRLVGIALLVEAVIPFGDMSIILGSGGSKSRAFSIHGVTCAVMLVVGLLLVRAIWEECLWPFLSTVRRKRKLVRFLITGENSSGNIAAFEVVVPSAQRLAAPAHSHDHYEETIYGIRGVLTWTVDREQIDVGPG
jgi:hypothetical protein